MKFLTPVLAVVAVLSLISNVLIYERFNNKKPVITVGSQPISKYDYENAVEQTPTSSGPAGMAALRKMVFTSLVRQAAAKAGVMPTDAQVDAQIKEMEARSPQTAQQAAADPNFKYDKATDMALQNLRTQGVTASEAEINAFFDRNKAALATPPQVQTTMVVSQSKGDSVKAEQLLQQGVSPEAIAAQPGLHVAGVNGFNVNLGSLPAAVSQQIGKTVLSMKPGQITTMPVGPYFVTFKAKSVRPAVPAVLANVRDLVALDVKLQKAVTPQQELVSLYQANPPVFNNPHYADYFKDMQAAAQQKTASTH